jgi:ubiquinone/menaquinone biosynthesis C-methylase UbiE
MASEDSTATAQRESAERFDPAEMGGGLMEAEHRGRYWWATPWIAGKEVLDAGCGVGYGIRLLAEHDPARLVGVDISAEALSQASADEAEFVEADLRELPFEADSFDVVVCFEVIEHVEGHDRVLDELRRVLRPGGTLLISSPNRDVYAPGNPHHVHEFLPDELREALGQRFGHVGLHGQHVQLATAIVSDGGLAVGAQNRPRAFTIGQLEPGRETYTLAIARDEPFSAPEDVVVVGDAFEVRWWHEQVNQLTQAKDLAEGEAARRNRQVLDMEQVAARIPQLEHDLDETTRDLWAMEQELIYTREVIDDMKASVSWRLTAPLRALKRLRR